MTFSSGCEPKLLARVNILQTSSPSKFSFYRNASWCPDGSAILSQCEDHTLRIYIPPSNEDDLIVPGFILKHPSPVLSYAWFPTASRLDPQAYCFVESVRECPVRLIDASSGNLRASYKIVDHRERQIAPYCMAFNLMGTKLYCGFESAVEVFDVHSPGEGERLKTVERKKDGGFKGIMSSIAFSPDHSGIYAVSSLTSGVSFMSEGTGSQIISWAETPRGTTQVKFHPTKPHLVYTAARRLGEILSWDNRFIDKPLHRLLGRNVRTNQRLSFDIDPGGRWLAAGDDTGMVRVWNLDLDAGLDGESVENVVERLGFQGHKDSVGSVAFHPAHQLTDLRLLTASGSRHFDIHANTDSDPDSDKEVLPEPQSLESSIRLWDIRIQILVRCGDEDWWRCRHYHVR